jgi:aminopeptidase N
MNIFNFFVLNELQKRSNLCFIALFFMLCNACEVKKPISKENGMAMEPIVVSKNNPMLIYRATAPLDFLIQKTDLNVRFNFEAHQLIGVEKLSIQALPMKPIDSIALDAKGMEIASVEINGRFTAFRYVKNKLHFALPTTLAYPALQIITIGYTANPDKVDAVGSAAIRGAKGLYFINTDKKDVYKPMQVWTQGETEANSCWFPTVDKPNNKSTFRIAITVPDSMTTLSNGLLISSKKNGEFRTDVWTQNTAMSAYLAMMAVGVYSKTEDVWRSKSVDYFVEKIYAADAKENFNHTPEMIEFFSKKLGVDFPWDKYSQITARDYVSGAMENTSASLFGEFVQKHHGELIDNVNDGIVAHELFHQWFGDLVTCESWSNLVLNEGFATYGEYLWYENKYGKEFADRQGMLDMNRYLQFAESDDGPIVRFYYRDKETMFSPITYKKGGRVLHLLRAQLGDTMFFEGLRLYLNQYAYNTAEVHDLRKILEKVSGQDLNVFFNQWFYKGGHPKLKLQYTLIHKNTLQINYTQANDSVEIYTMPLEWKIVSDKNSVRKKVWIDKKEGEFTIDITALQLADTLHLPAIIADAEHYFIGEIIDNKNIEEVMKNYYAATNITDKSKAITQVIKMDSLGVKHPALIYAALQDDNKYVRNSVLKYIDIKKSWDRDRLKNIFRKMATDDDYAPNRATAIEFLGAMQDKQSINIYINACTAESFKVVAHALLALKNTDSVQAYQQATKLADAAKGEVKTAIGSIYAAAKNTNNHNFFTLAIATSFGNERIALLQQYADYLFNNPNEKSYDNVVKTLLQYAINDERESIKIASVRKLNNIVEDVKNKKLLIASKPSDAIILEIETALQALYKNEKNTKAIAEYKRVGWMK